MQVETSDRRRVLKVPGDVKSLSDDTCGVRLIILLIKQSYLNLRQWEWDQ